MSSMPATETSSGTEPPSERNAGERSRTDRVLEAVGDSPVATRELWRFLLSIDWMDMIEAWLLPVDHPLFLLVARINRLALTMQDALWIRPGLLTWGATTQETTRAYPGDELVPEPDGGATMATTLPAPPEAVWSWLVQMGGDRGGWYSWDLLDNNGRPSTDRIVPEW